MRAEGLAAQRIFLPSTAFAAPAVFGRVWGLDYPFTMSSGTLGAARHWRRGT